MNGRLALPPSQRDHWRGDPSAPVNLLQYGDFECPFCGQAYYVVKRLEVELGDEMSFVFRNFPLSKHPHALPAALAAEAAGQQDGFWEMHDLLFENQTALEPQNILSYAEYLELDLPRFVADWRSDRVLNRVQEDQLSGIRSGVSGTPTFFINGRRHDGPHDYETLLGILVKEMRYSRV
jgi:protein-disulfide isomerase